MAMIQVRCKDCHSETSMACFNQLSDLKYVPGLKTAYEELKEKSGNETEVFNSWLEEQKDQGAVSYGTDKSGDQVLYIKGHPVFDESQRWEGNGSKCPDCGSENTEWY